MNYSQNTLKKRYNSRSFTSTAGKREYMHHSGRRNNHLKSSILDTGLLIKEAGDPQLGIYSPDRTFDEMPVSGELKAILRKKGYVYPTEIQDKTFELILAGHDLLGTAQTGTGKTGAFLIPLIHRMKIQVAPVRTLVIVPTRELAVQVEMEFKSMTKGLDLFSACFIGGTNLNSDLVKLRREMNLIVGTPGRLLDLVNRKVLDLGKFPVLILDEFDRMLDMGFVDDVMRLTGSMSNRKQTLLFSATEEESQRSLIAKLLNNPIEVKVNDTGNSACFIEQNILKAEGNDEKFRMLLGMIRQEDFVKVLVFPETRRMVNTVYTRLRKSGISVDQIHGDKSQAKRQAALNSFKSGMIQVLVATDVAARGIDVDDITHVINFQLPRNIKNYIHRIGRTGRAGKSGKAFTFIN